MAARKHESVAAVIRARAAADPEAIAITGDGHYKCPTRIEWVDALPRNPSGKVLRRELRAPYWQHLDRQVG